MSRINTARDAWHPQTREDRDAVLLELHEILASPPFCNSKRYPALLQYIVENTLAGKADLLKERTLGVEVFDRPTSYDTNTDTVVRYTAGEVRKRLSLYYHEHGRNSRIHILLPAGSYVPEFVLQDESEDTANGVTAIATHPSGQEGSAEQRADLHGAQSMSFLTASTFDPTAPGPLALEPSSVSGKASSKRLVWTAIVAILIALVFAGWWRYHSSHAQTSLDAFWNPVLRDQRTVPICSGSSVFAPNNFSGVATASKDIEYPFLSMQMAASIARLSGLLQQHGTGTQLISSASAPLTDLREHPVILLGGYNNRWTMRLLQPLRFHFPADPAEAIVDQIKPQTPPERQWVRDRSLPYSSADDYALVARFRDASTNSWVVVVAGLGRNGTEGAAQFVTSSDYMQLLQDRIGADLTSKNVEVILKVSVIDGKTAAPKILATHVW
jgi:hypothetical protein